MRHSHHIRQIRIESAQALESEIVRRFAQDCGTIIEPRFPLYFVFVDGRLAAFYYLSEQACVYPTVHPDWPSPRSFYEAARAITGATQAKWGNPLWLVGSDSKLNHPELLKKVGLEARPLAVYEPEAS